MNCKQGDIAIVVRSRAGNEGKIVQCLELLVSHHFEDVDGRPVLLESGTAHIWRIDRPLNVISLVTGEITKAYYCTDECLRPLKGDLQGDEEIDAHPLETVHSPQETV